MARYTHTYIHFPMLYIYIYIYIRKGSRLKSKQPRHRTSLRDGEFEWKNFETEISRGEKGKDTSGGVFGSEVWEKDEG